MAKDLLTAAEVKAEWGYDKASLIRWEKDGKLKGVIRTPGNQRRYTRASIMSLSSPQVPGSSEKDLYRELGTSGLNRFAGAVYEESLRELRGSAGRIMYREMRQNDPVLAAVFFALSHSLKQAKWRVSPASEEEADKEAALFIEQCMDDMSFSWSDTLTFIIDPMLEQGFSLLELCYKRRLGDNPPKYVDDPAISIYNDGRIGWRKMAPRPPESLSPGNEWLFDEHGGIQGINQVDPATSQSTTIPIDKLLHFRTTVHPANTPEPPPIHRAAYLPYWYSKNMMEIEGIGVERDLAGIPVIYLGNDRSLSDDPSSDYTLAKELVTNIRQDEQVGVVIPGPKMGEGAPEGQGWLLELLSSGGSRQHDTGAIIERYDKRKALVVLAQFIMLGMEQVGSFALSKHQGDLFVLAATAWIESIAGIINRHAIPRLIKMNVFPGITGMPKLVPDPLGLPDLAAIAEYVNKLVDKEVLTPDDELERHLRQIADLPQRIEPEEGEDVKKRGDRGNIDKTSLLLSRLRNSLEPMVNAGLLGLDEYNAMLMPTLDKLRGDILRNNESVQLSKHIGEVVEMACPFCGHDQAELFKDHGGLCVCKQCLSTFDPVYHYGNQTR
jgi:hypothetical protein